MDERDKAVAMRARQHRTPFGARLMILAQAEAVARAVAAGADPAQVMVREKPAEPTPPPPPPQTLRRIDDDGLAVLNAAKARRARRAAKLSRDFQRQEEGKRMK